ncbi:MAG: hypothetical protein AAF939_12625 [Planctomycetota bacterium]
MNPDTFKTDATNVELDRLVGLFFDQSSELGSFLEVTSDSLPASYRNLLAHDHHMTVTVEDYHGCAVNVRVLKTRTDGNRYSRKILLNRTSDNQVVQFGIVRLNTEVLADQVRQEIQSEQIPLGRVLINHDVLRQVKLLKLYKIEMGTELRGWFDFHPSHECFGRTALIYCDGAPAIELLEIVVG